MMDLRFDEAFDFVVGRLVLISGSLAGPNAGQLRDKQNGYDVSVHALVGEYWKGRGSGIDEASAPAFYDAAWELARMGVLRPGRYNPSKSHHFASVGFDGSEFSITDFGTGWLKDATNRPYGDPSRWASMLQSFGRRFGAGYIQRATEAVQTYRTNNYLAACVMAGAAAESILITIAVAKVGDEARVLAQYRRSGGRRSVTAAIVGNVPAGVRPQFETALQVLHYWRDDAAHGTATTISEIEAFAAMTQLLRLAQFANDNWAVLSHP